MRRAKVAVSAALATVLLTSLAGTRPLRAAANAWTVNGPSRLRLVTPYRVAPAAGEVRLGKPWNLPCRFTATASPLMEAPAGRTGRPSSRLF